MSSPNILRLIYQGRFLHGNVTLGGEPPSHTPHYHYQHHITHAPFLLILLNHSSQSRIMGLTDKKLLVFFLLPGKASGLIMAQIFILALSWLISGQSAVRFSSIIVQLIIRTSKN